MYNRWNNNRGESLVLSWFNRRRRLEIIFSGRSLTRLLFEFDYANMRGLFGSFARKLTARVKLRFGPDKHGRRVSKESCRRCEINIWRCAENRIPPLLLCPWLRSLGRNQPIERERERVLRFFHAVYSSFSVRSITYHPSRRKSSFLFSLFFLFRFFNPISLSNLINFNGKKEGNNIF